MSAHARLPKESNEDSSITFVDITQKFISDQWRGLNYNMDSFFSNQNYKMDQNKSMILAYYGLYKKEGRPAEYKFDIKIKVHLPRTTSKMKIVIEKERDELFESTSTLANSMSNTGSANAGETVRSTSYTAGLNYLLFDSPYYKSYLDTGLKILLPLDPFAKLRFEKEVKTKYIDIYAGQKFILYRQDGFQEITQLSFSKYMNKFFQVELANSLSWEDKNDEFNFRNNLVLYHLIDHKKSFAYSIGANAKLSPTFYYSSYDASINYRHLLHSSWLYGYFALGADFPKNKDFEMEKFVQARLEVFFR